MITLKKHFLMDLDRNQKLVQLNYNDYTRLMDYLEDMEDALELKQAKKEAKGFTSLDDLKKELAYVSNRRRK